jgi:hypothetical protein
LEESRKEASLSAGQALLAAESDTVKLDDPWQPTGSNRQASATSDGEQPAVTIWPIRTLNS